MRCCSQGFGFRLIVKCQWCFKTFSLDFASALHGPEMDDDWRGRLLVCKGL